MSIKDIKIRSNQLKIGVTSNKLMLRRIRLKSTLHKRIIFNMANMYYADIIKSLFFDTFPIYS